VEFDARTTEVKSLAKVLTSSVDAMMRSIVDGREGDARCLDAREESRWTSEKEMDRPCSCPAPTRARNGTRRRAAIIRLARRRYEVKMEEEEEPKMGDRDQGEREARQ
jgi:hypothetical protein